MSQTRMARTRTVTTQLQPVVQPSAISEPMSGWEDTPWRRSPGRTPSSSVPESHPEYPFSLPYVLGASIGYRSLSSPAGSSRVH